MSKMMRYMAFVLIIIMVFAFPSGVFAKDGSDDPAGDDHSSSGSDDSNDDSSDDSSGSDSSGHGSDDPPGDDSRSGLDDSISSSLSGNAEYMALVAEKNALSNQIDALKDQLDVAKDGNDSALESRLESELRTLKNQKDAVESEMFQLSGEDRFKPYNDSRNSTEAELNALKNQRDAVERELLRLRTELSTLAASGDTSGQAALRQQIAQQEALKDSLQIQISQKKLALKDMLRNLYSDDEWNAAAQLQLLLNKNKDMRSLPINSILISGKTVKLDTPPVIFAGRTLIPVRAISTALGATVLWNEQEQKITIQKDGSTVEFEIGDDSMKVNGNSVHLEVPPQVINRRTVIPLRAMAESLGIQAVWDDALQIIELQ